MLSVCESVHSNIIVLRLLSELGSGEFGVVRSGVWSVGGEEREVAIKTLADGSTKEKRIQFLQEAAIMSQFKHPNVITLYGVLMEKEPVIFLSTKNCYILFTCIIKVPHILFMKRALYTFITILMYIPKFLLPISIVDNDYTRNDAYRRSS